MSSCGRCGSVLFDKDNGIVKPHKMAWKVNGMWYCVSCWKGANE